ncbi:hypothetical protein BT69DRAFT_1379769 [Atractiella rhizophila]|nr:hypothetical protein BT69DRAFT_1379769 [Atractiella rhizophila]
MSNGTCLKLAEQLKLEQHPTVPNPALNGPLALTFTTMMASRIVLHLRSAASGSHGQNTGPSASSGRSNIVPKFRNGDVSAVPDVHLQSVGRRMEGGLQASYAGVIVDVETEINVEKRLEAVEDVSAEGEREYRLSDEGVVKKS